MKKLLMLLPVLMLAACGHQYSFRKGDMSNFVQDEYDCHTLADAFGRSMLLTHGRDWGTYMQCMKLQGYTDANP